MFSSRITPPARQRVDRRLRTRRRRNHPRNATGAPSSFAQRLSHRLQRHLRHALALRAGRSAPAARLCSPSRSAALGSSAAPRAAACHRSLRRLAIGTLKSTRTSAVFPRRRVFDPAKAHVCPPRRGRSNTKRRQYRQRSSPSAIAPFVARCANGICASARRRVQPQTSTAPRNASTADRRAAGPGGRATSASSREREVRGRRADVGLRASCA